MANDFLSFKLPDDFVDSYREKEVPWGFPIGAGNSLGELTFITKYSRRKEDGSKETWVDTGRRVIEGMFSIQKDWCKENRLPWNENKAQATAKDAFDRLFVGKWTPPGRGLWMMGTEFVHAKKNSAALQNCSFLSTEHISTRSVHDATWPFVRLMEMSMLGVGVGFDTKGADKLTIHQPLEEVEVFVVEDSREGWCESVGKLLESYFFAGRPTFDFDYSLVRPSGEPINGFGGTAAGPGPLIDLHNSLKAQFNGREGQKLTSTDIVDIQNKIGRCVVAGNVRRSAEIALGSADDKDFLDLKNWEVNPERMGANGWGHTSNNSIIAEVGGNYDNLAERIADNGEPGLVYLDLCRKYGRLIDPPTNKDYRVAGTNPCAEQSLESGECCVTAETLIQTRYGIAPIGDLVGIPVEVWNGENWSEVTPFSTGTLPTYRVTLSDGSILDASEGHEWLARKSTQRVFREIRTSDLEVGMYLPEFELSNMGGKPVDAAYEWGWFTGDGYIDGQKVLILIQENEYSVIESMKLDSVYSEQTNGQNSLFRRASLRSVLPLDTARILRNHDEGLPQEVLAMDSESISNFVAGWIDTDGSVIRQENTDHYVLYGDEKKLRDLQILLRRIGINHSTLRLFSSAGTETNKGIRNQDLWRLLIPSYESAGIPTRIKVATKFGTRFGVNNRHPASQIDRARKQKVVSIDFLGSKETYCFDEPVLHRGVFGNVLTKQCTLVETFPVKHDSLEDYKRTIKVAYLYAKSVTLLPTHWPETNSIMQRNRRIGCSISGVAQFAERYGWAEMKTWLNDGYNEVQRYDVVYSDWLGVRESIKTTSVKPSGTVSLLFGVTPGVHWPTADVYIRRMRLASNDPLLEALGKAGYHTEPDVMDPVHSVVVELPTRGPQVRTEREVTMWEKASLAVLAQRYWADNQVSVTITFQPQEKDQIGALLRSVDGQLKSISMLPLLEEGGAYAQMPYERISEEVWEESTKKVKAIKWASLYAGKALDAEGEKFCSNDVCMI